MRIEDARTGRAIVRKRRRRRDEPGQARHLNFSCFHGYPFLNRDRTRRWFLDALQAARHDRPIDVRAYVIMPEHVHLLVRPRGDDATVSGFLRAIKEPVARLAIHHLKENAPNWLDRIAMREGTRLRHRFWQPGGGCDHNLSDGSSIGNVIAYIHADPVRRGLVERPEAWEWSSARWYMELGPCPIEMDRTLPPDL